MKSTEDRVMKFNKILLAVIASVGVVGSVQADIVSGQSYTNTVDGLKLGAAYDGSGTAGGGVVGELRSLNTSFQNHLVSFIDNPSYGGSYDANTGIYHLAAGIDLAGIAFPHTGLGVWNFKKVGADDTWYGEWSKETQANGAYTGQGDDSTRTVFYVGNDTGTTVPSAGTASYTVNGVNNGNLLSGTYNANFANGTLEGQLTGSGTVTSLEIAANFAVGDAKFSGDAVANNTIVGTTSGQFFGANAASLAGIATFANNRAYDTAFGGVKQ